MGSFITPDGQRYDLPGIDDPGTATQAMQSHPVLKGNIPEGTRFVAGGATATEPSPMSPVEGASPWEVGQVPSKEETYPVVRGAAQMSIGAPAWLGGSPIAGGAASALAGAGVDLLYGKTPDPDQVAMDAALGMAIPGGAALLGKGARNLAGKAAVKLYESAAKYPTTLKMADKTRIALAGIRERIMFNPKSIEKLGDLNEELTSVADEAMVYAQMRGEGVPTKGIKDAFWTVTNRMKKDPIFDKRMSEGIQATYGQAFDELPAYMSPKEVLAWRRSLNEQLTGYFDRAKKMGLVGGEAGLKKGQEAVRASVNSEIIGMVPELKALGQRQKDVIDLLIYTERATSRISNFDILGLGSLFMGNIMADAAGVDAQTKGGALGTAAAGMLAWRIAGSPNAKARLAFMLAKVGKLDSASTSTLELIGITRDAAKNLSPKMKALPYPRTMGGPAKPDRTGIVNQKVEQEMTYDVDADVYERTWRRYASDPNDFPAMGRGQFDATPKSPRLTDRAPMPNEYGSPGPPLKMLSDPGRFRNPPPEAYGGAVSSRGRAIVDSVGNGQMHPIIGARELSNMANDALNMGNTYAAEVYRKMAKTLLKKAN